VANEQRVDGRNKFKLIYLAADGSAANIEIILKWRWIYYLQLLDYKIEELKRKDAEIKKAEAKAKKR
jgi:hypothetical protein